MAEDSTETLQRAIWIASYPRSGNTWVRAFIHNLLREIRGKAADAQDINRLNKHTVWEVDGSPYEQLLGKPLPECSAEELARTRPQVQRLLSEARSRPFFIKTHLAAATVEGFPTINLAVTLAAIYVVRNPLDIVVSEAGYGRTEIDPLIDRMADRSCRLNRSERHVDQFMGSWSTHVAGWTSIAHRPVHVIRYEDMLHAPHRVFGALARFLRLAPTPEQLQRAIDKSSFSELSRQERDNGFREKQAGTETFFRVGQAEQWREGLSPQQVSRIIRTHAPMMQRTGYLPPNCGQDVEPPLRAPPQAAVPGAPETPRQDQPGLPA